MSRLPWLVGGAVTWYLWMRNKSGTPTKAPPPIVNHLPGRWVWPVPSWNGRSPLISDGYDSPRPGLPLHGGVDIMFERMPKDVFKPGTPNASKLFVMPDGLTAVAASDGLVWSAMQTPQGFAVVIDHGPTKASTFYTHLEKLLVKTTSRGKAGERVRAGQPIGVIGANPLDAAHLKHLHFELWLGGPSDRVDPSFAMQSWETVADAKPGTRNAGLVYRPVGASGERYPDWIRALDGKSGVYVIRDRESHEVLYVGSSVGRLYDTLTRHFQTWRRYKGFWKGQYGEGHDPGLTYDRDSVEVAVRTTSSSSALDAEMQTISRLAPRDNLVGQRPTDEEEVPF